MIALFLAILAGYGAFLIWTALTLQWTGVGVGPTLDGKKRRWMNVAGMLDRVGLPDVRLIELLIGGLLLMAIGTALAWVLFGGRVVPALVGLGASAVPVGAARRRLERSRAAAREAWPALIEEMRLQTGSLGRSLPQALIAVGSRAPESVQPAFDQAKREWFLSTDFPRTVEVLKGGLADPTADAVCETLLIAHTVGGNDIDLRLQALAEDRIADLEGRKDAASKQAGAKFARRFVILVPIGMALAGLSIGQGRQAFTTDAGQAGVVVAFALIGVCWLWAGRIMRLPTEERVFR